jgi:hypothetical protein
LPLIENPIKKVLLIVTGDEGEVYIDKVGGSEEDDANEDGSDNIRRKLQQQIEQDEIQALQSQVGGLQRENHELKAQLELFSNHVDHHFTTLHHRIQWIAVQPAHPIRRNAPATAAECITDGNQAGPAATLSSHPRSIHSLWTEYEFGIGGGRRQKTLQQQSKEE